MRWKTTCTKDIVRSTNIIGFERSAIVGEDYKYAYLQVDSYRHLGDDLFYAALKYDFKGGVGSEDVYILIADDYTHVVVEKTGAKFGFTLLLKIKAEDELLRENIKCPSDMEKMKKVSNRNYGK